MREAAAFSKVGYQIFRREAKAFGLWDPNPSGNRPGPRTLSNKFLYSILRGEVVSSLRETTLMKKAWSEGFLEMKCHNCDTNFNHFIPPMVPPLVLDFLDMDVHNGKIDNLRCLCLNCVYELRHSKHKAWYRHREHSLDSIISNEPHLTADTNTTDTIENDVENDVENEVEFIPFEEFQKSLE